MKNQFAASTTELTSPSTDNLNTKKRHDPFIPINAEPLEEVRASKAYVIPWLGFAALLISAITIIGSWLILHFIDKKTVFTAKFAKPAVSSPFNTIEVGRNSRRLVMALGLAVREQRLSSHCPH
jgi:hypothetical protein